MKIAVVIPAHNERDYIPDILATVEAQTRTPDFVVVSADACTDDTADVAREIFSRWSDGARTCVIAVNCRSIAGARNRGMETVPEADAFLCVDSDSLLSPTVVAEMHAALTAGYEYGGFQLVPDARLAKRRSGMDKFLALLWLEGVRASNRRVGNFVGTGVFFRRDANTGYDEAWGWAEDIELCERMRRDGKTWKYLSGATLVYCDRRFIERGYWREIWGRIGRGLGHYRKPRTGKAAS